MGSQGGAGRRVADQLEELADLEKAEIKQSYCINTDATGAPCRLPKEENRQVNGNMYVYIGGSDRPYNVFAPSTKTAAESGGGPDLRIPERIFRSRPVRCARKLRRPVRSEDP